MTQEPLFLSNTPASDATLIAASEQKKATAKKSPQTIALPCSDSFATPPKPVHGLRILHTSDWHLGKRLHNEARYAEFTELLDWMVEIIRQVQVDVLVVAGDVFDTMTPSNRAQELYYQFLGKLPRETCRHVIITAGNHDSPSFLEAPKSLLKAFCVHVVGIPSRDIAEEVLVLKDKDDMPELIVAAVPYLRDKDVRQAVLGESSLNKEHNTAEGIRTHYAAVAEHCQNIQAQIARTHNKHVPIVATGHLFVVGASKSAEDDGMRDLYVGSLGAITADIFSNTFDYVALGHIHAAQSVAGRAHIRYSGSPMAMGFGEADSKKSVTIIDFTLPTILNSTPAIHLLPLPNFRRLVRIAGDWAAIEDAITQLKHAPITSEANITPSSISNKTIWLDIHYTGKKSIQDLPERIAALIGDAPLAALSIKNKQYNHHRAPLTNQRPSLQSLSPTDVFSARLAAANIDADASLFTAYQHLLQALYDEDAGAE